MRNWFADRYCSVVASAYLYNEYRGYSELERLLAALREKYALEQEFIAAVEKHALDERKHYLMFRHYFESHGAMPLALGRGEGYIDRFIKMVFHSTPGELNSHGIVGDRKQFFRLCRLVMMTEFRGMKQVQAMLSSRFIRQNHDLERIFRIIERDEPSHCYPYQTWLRTKGSHEPALRERIADAIVHYTLIGIRLPFLFLNPFAGRLKQFPA